MCSTVKILKAIACNNWPLKMTSDKKLFKICPIKIVQLKVIWEIQLQERIRNERIHSHGRRRRMDHAV